MLAFIISQTVNRGSKSSEALSQFLYTSPPSLSGQFNAVVKAWNHKQGEQGGGDGAPNDGHRHGPVKLAAFTDANGDGQHACNQRESGHDDGAQTLRAVPAPRQ